MTHSVPTVLVDHPTLEGRVMKINEADYDEGVHGPIVKAKLPKKKKTTKKAKKGADSED